MYIWDIPFILQNQCFPNKAPISWGLLQLHCICHSLFISHLFALEHPTKNKLFIHVHLKFLSTGLLSFYIWTAPLFLLSFHFLTHPFNSVTSKNSPKHQDVQVSSIPISKSRYCLYESLGTTHVLSLGGLFCIKKGLYNYRVSSLRGLSCSLLLPSMYTVPYTKRKATGVYLMVWKNILGFLKVLLFTFTNNTLHKPSLEYTQIFLSKGNNN